jgi:hypothetical protein
MISPLLCSSNAILLVLTGFLFLYLLPLGILSTIYLFHIMFLAVKNGSHEIQCRNFSTILGSPGQESEIAGITTQKGV